MASRALDKDIDVHHRTGDFVTASKSVIGDFLDQGLLWLRRSETPVGAKTIKEGRGSMQKKLTAIVLGGLMAVPLGGMSVSFAAAGRAVETRLQAKLRQPVVVGATPVADFGGKVQYKKKSSATRGMEEEFSAKVESPIPNMIAGVDENNAADVMFMLKIFPGTPTAPGAPPATEKGSCILLIKAIEFEYTGGTSPAGMEAEYAAKVKEKTPLAPALPSFSSKIGTCQTAPAVAGGPAVPGIPDVALGDRAEIYGGTSMTPLLVGTFQAGGRDDDDDD